MHEKNDLYNHEYTQVLKKSTNFARTTGGIIIQENICNLTKNKMTCFPLWYQSSVWAVKGCTTSSEYRYLAFK